MDQGETLDFQNRFVTYRQMWPHLGHHTGSGRSIMHNGSNHIGGCVPLSSTNSTSSHCRKPKIDGGIQSAYNRLDAGVSYHGMPPQWASMSVPFVSLEQKMYILSYFLAGWHLRRPSAGSASSHRLESRENTIFLRVTRTAHRSYTLHDAL